MRFLLPLCIFIAILGASTGHRGVRFHGSPRSRGFSGAQPFRGQPGSFHGNFPSSPLIGNFPSRPLISGSPNINSPTPTGARGCFCLPANQVCDPSGVIPQGSTRISEVNTRIVNTNPESRCPQGENECCFGSSVGPGPLPPVTNPVSGCGGRANLHIPGKKLTSQADFGEYPWMVAIVGVNNDFVAGGVLINPSWVLTAAHKLSEPGQVKVRVGDYDLAVANEVPQFPHQEALVAQVILHPKFQPKNLFNDVALLRLQQPVAINRHINPACLPEKGQRFAGQRCYVSGWGQNIDGQFQAILKEVDVPIVEELDCQARLRRTRLGETFKLNQESFVCAGGEAGKDACGGDGGSPLVCDEGGVYTVVGLVAWGIGCGQDGVPGVYVNVANFAEFIEQQLYGGRG